MDRYSIITKKPIPTPVKSRKGASNKPMKPRPVKKLTEEWVIEDQEYRVSLEISPRNSTCANYACKINNCLGSKYSIISERIIKKGTPRYKVIDRRGYYSKTALYHRSCLPQKIRKFIKDFSNRDIPKERMNDSYNYIVRILESTNEEIIGTKYFKQLLKKIGKYLDDNN